MNKLLLPFLILSVSAFGQIVPQFDNYSGSNSAYLNPSSIAGAKWKTYFNVGILGLRTSTSAVKNETIPFSGKNLKLGGNNHSVDQANLLGLAFMFQFNNNHAFSINTRYVASQNFLGSPEFSSWLKNKDDIASGSIKSMDVSQNTYLEYNLYYAAPVLDMGRHYLKIGAGFSLLKGALNSELQSGGNFDFSNQNLQYSMNNFSLYSTAGTHSSDIKITDLLLGKVIAGNGKAFSGGLTYEFRKAEDRYHYTMNGKVRDDPSQAAYLVKVGFSMNNIGSINYDGTAYSANNKNGKIGLDKLQDAGGTTDLLGVLEKELKLIPTAQEIEYKLPQNLVAQVDVNFAKDWYAGVVHIKHDLYSKTYFGPRKEGYGGAFGVMGIYDSFTKKIGWAAHFRSGIFTLGTENVEGFFSKKASGAQAYFGISIPIKRASKLSDSDGDSVSDNKDECPNIPGFWAFKGCPDTDGDGIEDRLDDCPNEAGPKETGGCPDSDGDGIFDKNDACPHVAGLAKFNGCPDTDGDGIPDQDDKCPNEPGLSENGGCPDEDGDGYLDNEDSCPKVKGIRELDGCPLVVTTQISDFKSFIEELSYKTRMSETAMENVKLWKEKNPSKDINFVFSGKNQEKLLELAGVYKDNLPENVASLVTFTVRLDPSKPYSLFIETK